MSKTEKKRANSIITQRVWQGNREYTVHGIGTLILYPDKVSAECRAYAMGHGFDQRVRDAGAIPADRDTGKPATPQEKYDAMKRIVDHLNSGSSDWNLKPAANPGLDTGLTLTAMMRALGKSLEEVEAIIAATMAKRGVERTGALKVWAASKQVAQAILDIRRERADSGADVDELLADILGDEGEDDEAGDEPDDEALM